MTQLDIAPSMIIGGMENLPRTPAKAKASGSKYYFTGIACKRGHFAPRQASNKTCSVCNGMARDKAERSDAGREKLNARCASFKKAKRATSPDWAEQEREKNRLRARRRYDFQRSSDHYEHFMARIESEDAEFGL